MSFIIRIKRGAKEQIEGSVLQIGELAFAIDTEELYIGTGTGKVSFLSSDNFIRVKNVKFFGAKGDGKTDDTSVLLDVFENVNDGDIIYFPSGTYILKSQISIFNKKKLTILGSKNSIIQATGYNGLHFYFNDCENITIKGITFRGEGIDSVNAVGGIFFDLTNNDNNPYHIIEDCFFLELSNTALTIAIPVICNIKNVICRLIAGYCFNVFNGTSTNFDTCYALTSTQSGFRFYNMTYCSLNSCATEVNGVGYEFINSKSIVCNGCGSKDQINREPDYPGIAFRSDNSFVVLNACYARNSAYKHLDEINNGKFIILNFYDNDLQSNIIGKNFDADKLDGYDASINPAPYTIPVTDSTGKLKQEWLPPISASAGGDNFQVQYNAFGNLAGTSKLLISSQNDNPILIPTYADLSDIQPPSDGLLLFVKKIGKPIFGLLSDSGIFSAIQHALFSKQIGYWFPAGNSTTVYAWGLAIGTTGTATARNVATTNFATQLRRIAYVSGTSAGSSAGIRGSYLQWWRGNAPGLGGFLMATRFIISQVNATCRWFVGMTATTSALSNADPSTFTNIVGIGINSGQTTIRVFYNDASGTASSIDLGKNFPATNTNAVYNFYLYTPSNGDRFYYYVRRLDAPYEASGELTIDIPNKTQLLSPQLWINNGTTTGAVAIDICWLYMEAEY